MIEVFNFTSVTCLQWLYGSGVRNAWAVLGKIRCFQLRRVDLRDSNRSKEQLLSEWGKCGRPAELCE